MVLNCSCTFFMFVYLKWASPFHLRDTLSGFLQTEPQNLSSSLDFFRLNLKTLFLSGFLQTEPQNLSFSKTIDLPCFLLSHGCFPIVSPCTVSVYARLVHCLCCTCARSPCVRMHECGLRIVLLNQIWGIVDTFIVIVILQARHKIWGIVDSFIIVVLL